MRFLYAQTVPASQALGSAYHPDLDARSSGAGRPSTGGCHLTDHAGLRDLAIMSARPSSAGSSAGVHPGRSSWNVGGRYPRF